jgi:RNA polymerase sigma-70 factor (ECF subfamily)
MPPHRSPGDPPRPDDMRPTSASRADEAMLRYARGEDRAFSELYDDVAPRLTAYLMRQTRDRSITEDLVQQTFLQMHRSRGTFSPGAPVLPWAFAIARRIVIDGHRSGVRRDRVFDGREAPDAGDDDDITGYDRVYGRELAEQLEAVLAELPPAQRTAFELLRVDELTLIEAAQVTGTTVSSLKSSAHRAYLAVRKALGGSND